MSEIRGFCHNADQEEGIVAYGVPARDVFACDRGAESLEHCLSSFRGRPGTLILAQDVRAFGKTRRDVAEIMARLENAKIQVIDLTHREDVTISQLLARAYQAISRNHFVGDRQKARRRGRKGGETKARLVTDKREIFASKELVDRIVDCREIPWDLKAQLLAPHFSKATLRRQYGSYPTSKRA